MSWGAVYAPSSSTAAGAGVAVGDAVGVAVGDAFFFFLLLAIRAAWSSSADRVMAEAAEGASRDSSPSEGLSTISSAMNRASNEAKKDFFFIKNHSFQGFGEAVLFHQHEQGAGHNGGKTCRRLPAQLLLKHHPGEEHRDQDA